MPNPHVSLSAFLCGDSRVFVAQCGNSAGESVDFAGVVVWEVKCEPESGTPTIAEVISTCTYGLSAPDFAQARDGVCGVCATGLL